MKKCYILLISFFSLLILYSNVFADVDAMFGLKWGMSPTQVKKLNVNLKFKDNNANLYCYETTSLPKNLKDSYRYKLLFDEDKSLVKIMLFFGDIEGDTYGNKGKERFAEIESFLKNKYKISSSSKRIGEKLYDKPDEFYQCLKYKGCGKWLSTFKNDNKHIVLELYGLSREQGIILLNVEAAPEFHQALEKMKAINAQKEEKDGL